MHGLELMLSKSSGSSDLIAMQKVLAADFPSSIFCELACSKLALVPGSKLELACSKQQELVQDSKLVLVQVQDSKLVLELVQDSKLVLELVQDSKLVLVQVQDSKLCLLYTSPSPRDLSTSRMPSSA